MLSKLVLFLLMLVDIVNMGGIGSIFKSKYKMKLISIEKCNVPVDRCWDSEHKVQLTYIARKVDRHNTVLDVNYTIQPGAPPIGFNLRGYELQRNMAKNLVFKVENLTCKNTMVFQTMKITGFRLNSDCSPAPGTYTLKGVNLNDYAFMMSSIALAGPGKYGYEMESFSDKGLLTCIMTICDLILANKN